MNVQVRRDRLRGDQLVEIDRWKEHVDIDTRRAGVGGIGLEGDRPRQRRARADACDVRGDVVQRDFIGEVQRAITGLRHLDVAAEGTVDREVEAPLVAGRRCFVEPHHAARLDALRIVHIAGRLDRDAVAGLNRGGLIGAIRTQHERRLPAPRGRDARS
jgi:hypothetical protein